MPESAKGPVLKTGGTMCLLGSSPSTSAIFCVNERDKYKGETFVSPLYLDR